LSEVIGEVGAFGPAPQDVPGFTELSVDTDVAPAASSAMVSCTNVPTGIPNTPATAAMASCGMSGYNLAAVLAGLPNDLVKPLPIPPLIPPVRSRFVIPGP